MKPIYIDVTELLANRLYTGIQRVVRQIARGGMHPGPGRLIPVIAYRDQFYCLNAAGIAELCGPAGPSAAIRFTDDGPAMRRTKRLLGIIPPLYDRAQDWHFQRKMMSLLAGLFVETPLALGPDDRLVLLDSFWGGSTALRAARRIARTGCAVIAVIYDMIPVTHPQYCEARLARLFVESMDEVADICTGIVTISAYCRGVIEQFLLARGIEMPVRHFYLGADLVRSDAAVVQNKLPFVAGSGSGRVHLMVGTIEPRKGCTVVIDAFERLWQEGRDDQLVIIGKIGWHVDELVARLSGHPELGRRLFLIHDATDTTLAQAFDVADAAIMASTVEGFGLPLVEALYRKLPVIASDIPVFREIAGNSALYFTLGDDRDLARAVLEMEQRALEYHQAADSFEWINWSQAVDQFRSAIDEVTEASRVVRPVTKMLT